MSVQHCGSTNDPLEFGVFHLFCGIGGGALGFQRATARWKELHARFRTLGGIDVDPDACADFEVLTGVRATCMDLFSREDYAAFHGRLPAVDWREATPSDLRAAAGGERPDVVFLSPPCKGVSSLLPAARAASPKYQALNRLTVRGIRLALAAWADDPPSLVILENVPRITSSRGAALLAEIKRTLRDAGYVVADGTHDMGAVGGLSQHRVRYLLVARRPDRCPPVLFKPPKRKVRSIGEAIGPLPMPDDPIAGPMHRLPRLQWLTWVRLALIRAGHDWRDLQRPEIGRYRIVPTGCDPFNHIHRVTGFDDAAGAVTSSGDQAVADPRLGHEPRQGAFRVARWDETARTVTASAVSPTASNGVAAVADPRLPKRGDTFKGSPGLLGIVPWEAPAPAVTGSASASGSNMAASVADPRVPYRPDRRSGDLAVRPWGVPAGTVTGEDSIGSGAQSVADPRLACAPRNGAYAVTAWDEPAGTVTSAGDVHAQGASAVADPRLPADGEAGVWLIVAEDGTWHRPLTTLELAVLQGFPARLDDGRPLLLAGKSQAKWRERIGNAVPVGAAQAIATSMLETLIQARAGVAWSFRRPDQVVWVRPMRRIQRWLHNRRRRKVA